MAGSTVALSTTAPKNKELAAKFCGQLNRISLSSLPPLLSLTPPQTRQPSAVSVKDAAAAATPAVVPAPGISELDMSKVILD